MIVGEWVSKALAEWSIKVRREVPEQCRELIEQAHPQEDEGDIFEAVRAEVAAPYECRRILAREQ